MDTTKPVLDTGSHKILIQLRFHAAQEFKCMFLKIALDSESKDKLTFNSGHNYLIRPQDRV